MGFRGIDTANQRRHYFEAGVGQGLAAAYRAGVVTRGDLFLQTKFTYRWRLIAGETRALKCEPRGSAPSLPWAAWLARSGRLRSNSTAIAALP